MTYRQCTAAGVFLLGFAVLLGCVPRSLQVRSNALEFLYPQGAPATPPSEVTLTVPVRVGIAFPPSTAGSAGEFSEDRKRALLQRVAEAFRGRKEISSVQTIPTTYLQAGGGFDDLDRVARSFGIDVVALVSYDQVQFSDSTNASLAYWTLVGAYVVKGEKNETRTMLDAAVFDIRARAMLFNASGRSSVGGASTPIAVDKELRKRSDQGFAEATEDLIRNLDLALGEFATQAASGTVRGPGTPTVALVDPQGRPLPPGDSGGGAAGFAEVVGILLVLAVTRARRNGRRA